VSVLSVLLRSLLLLALVSVRAAATPLGAPTLRAAGAPRCTLESTEALGEKRGRLRSLGVAAGPSGGLAVWDGDTERSYLVVLGRDGRPAAPPRAVAVKAGHAILRIIALRERFLLLSSATLAQGGEWRLHALALDARGRPVGKPYSSGTEGAVIAGASGDSVLLYDGRRNCALYRLRLLPDGSIKSTTLGEVAAEDTCIIRPPPGFALDGERWAVLDYKSILTAARRTRLRGMSWLVDDPGGVLSFAHHGEGYAVLFRSKRKPIRHAVIKPDGSGKVQLVAPKAPLPAPFAEQVLATVERKGGSDRLVRRDLARRPVGEPLVIGSPKGSSREPRLVDVTWTGERFLVLYSDYRDRAWQLRLARVRCAP